MDAPLVQMRDVRFAYGSDGFALDVPLLEIARRERIACVGPSGCGKTTLINLITGIIRPLAGRIAFDGTELTALGERERRALRIARIGMVFQEFALLDYLTALENILLPYRLSPALRLTREARSHALSLAESVGISHTLARRPARLSHGERQRVALCRALVTQPDMLVCDEPTGSLDPERAAASLDLLLGEADRLGAALLVVTHDHSVLDRFERTVDMGAMVSATRREPLVAGGGAR